MLRLILAAGLALTALPAQAVTFIYFEASGAGTTAIYDNGPPTWVAGEMTAQAWMPAPGPEAYCGVGFACRYQGSTLELLYPMNFPTASLSIEFEGIPTYQQIADSAFKSGTILMGQGRAAIQQFSMRLVEIESPGDLRYGQANFLFTAFAVPEPATWAMMIAGFAMMGGALRRSGVRTLALSNQS